MLTQALNNMYNKIISTIIVLLVATIAYMGLPTDEQRPNESLGSVQRGSEYHGTLITPSSDAGGVLLTTGGTLGSVVVTDTLTSNLNFYKATTTNTTLRGNTATSSLEQVAAVNTASADNTYTFDIQVSTGLVYEFDGTRATTTITWRE